MLNRKKVYAEKAAERDLANLRVTWGLDGEDAPKESEDKSELDEIREELQLEVADASA